MSVELLATLAGVGISGLMLVGHGILMLRAGAAREARLDAAIEAVRVATETNREELERQIGEVRREASATLERHERNAGDTLERHERRLNAHGQELATHRVAIAEIRARQQANGSATS